MAERIDRARVLELLFGDGLDLSDCDSDEDDEDQVSSYLGDELFDPEELAALSRAVSSTQDVGRSVGDGAFVLLMRRMSMRRMSCLVSMSRYL